MDNNSNSSAAPDTSMVTTGISDRLSLFKSRLAVAKKFCHKPHKAWKKWMREYNIEDWDDAGEIRDKVRIGYLFRKAESELPAIFDDQPEIFIKGRHSDATNIAPLVTGLYDYLWDIQDLEEKIEDAGLYFEVLGMGIIKSPYVTRTQKVQVAIPQPLPDPDAQQDQQQGEDPTQASQEELDQQPQYQELDVPIYDAPKASAPDPFKVFFSPETKFNTVLDAEHCPYIIEKMVMTVEEIKAKFGKTVTAYETLEIQDMDGDLITSSNTNAYGANQSIQAGTVEHSDLKRVTVYEYTGVLPKQFAPKKSEWAYDKEYHAYFTMQDELLVEELQYPYKPYFLLGSYGASNRFFKFGDAKHLMPLIQELQIYRSMILGHTRRMANPKILNPTQSGADEEALRDPRSGVIVKYDNEQAPPTYLQPGRLGDEVKFGIDMARTDLEKESGTFDLAGGTPSSTVKTPKGIEVYSEAADKNVARKRKKVARFIRQLLLFQFIQIAQNWKPEDGKVINIVDGDNPQAVQVTQEVLEVIGGVNQLYNLEIEVESLSINRAQIKQDALNLFQLAADHRDVFNVDEVAKYLLQSGYRMKDADRFLLTAEQKQALAQNAGPQPQVNVRVMADAGSPAGAAILQNEGIINPQQSVDAVAPPNPDMAGQNHPVNTPPAQPSNISKYIQNVTGSGEGGE